MVKGSSQAMGIQAMLGDLGREAGIILKTDATAAKGIASRRGLGKVRHIEVNQLWLQDKVAKEDITVVKVNTHVNLADTLTKYVDSKVLNTHIRDVGLVLREGRHELMPWMEGEGEKGDNQNDGSEDECERY